MCIERRLTNIGMNVLQLNDQRSEGTVILMLEILFIIIIFIVLLSRLR